MTASGSTAIRRGLVLMALAMLTAVALQRFGPAERVDLMALDLMTPWLAAAQDDSIVVVEIDQQSLEELGRWPWPRSLHAALIERLAKAGPRAIGYDVLFAEPSEENADADAALAAAIASAGTVVLPVIAEAPAHGLPPVEILPFSPLPEAALALGHAHLGTDIDRRLRRLHLWAGIGDAYWPALALAVSETARNGAMPLSPPRRQPEAAALEPAAGTPRLDWVVADALIVPIPSDTLRLRHFSAAEVMRRPALDELAGSIVLVGATASGLKPWMDVQSGTSSSQMAPIHFQAFATQALLRGTLLTPSPWPELVAALLAASAFAPWLLSLLLKASLARSSLFLAPALPLILGPLALASWRIVLPFASVALILATGIACLRLLELGERLRRAQLERGLAHAALTSVADAVLTTDRRHVVDFVNPAAERLFALPSESLVGSPLNSLAPALAIRLAPTESDRAAAKGRRQNGARSEPSRAWRTMPLIAADGAERIVKATIRQLGGKPSESGYVITLSDVTEEQRLLEEVAFRASHDGLTNLPNRNLLIDRLDHAIQRASRRRRLVGVVFLDVDRLKSINDALGHAVGDAVLTELAVRLTRTGRSGDTVGRLGGDEFVVVLEDLGSRGEIEAIVARYRRCFVKPIAVDGRLLDIKASIGVACFPSDGATADALLRRADTAMYRAKSGGRDQIVFYDAELHGEESGGLLLDAALRQGIERGELELHYQPRIDLIGRRPAGVESLVRWRHPEQGFLPPNRFIGLAEETGSIVELGRWVIARACADLASPGLRHAGLRLSINVSVVQLKRDHGFVDFVRQTLARHDIAPDRLELEVTESLFLDPSLPMLGQRLADLAALGVHLSIDDFGTGYSSLAYINRFPFDRIKIDRSFVSLVARDKGAQAIVRAIVGLSEALAKKTTAEGVEEADQLAFLDELHCNEAQGYFFGRPVPLAELQSTLIH